MYRDTVKLDDAVAILRIMECSAFAYGGFDGNVDDVHNILYRDPMTMEFTPTADLDFLVFELQVLERYGLIDRMNRDDRRKALEYMNGGTSGAVSRWVDNGRPGGQGNSPWQSYAQNKGQVVVQEDHYGRMHFGTTQTQQPSNNGSDQRDDEAKRRRTGM